MDKSRNYKNYIFDLYGTPVDIHTDEEQELLWEKLGESNLSHRRIQQNQF